jgi:hypothetical protein
MQIKREEEYEEDEHVLQRYDVTRIPTPTGTKVFLDAEGKLHWPVAFFYPEVQQTDFIQDFHEDSMLMDHLQVPCCASLHP